MSNFDFKVTVSDISNHLSFVASKENIKFEVEALNLIAQKSDGAMRDALSLFDRLVIFLRQPNLCKSYRAFEYSRL